MQYIAATQPKHRPASADTAARPVHGTADEAESRRRLGKLAHVLDSAFALPGGYRVGLDGFIGLVPGVGDLTGAALSSYILAEAHRLGAPKVLLLRMFMNMLVETIVGVVPVLGDLFDFVWKANRRNVALLEEHLDRPHQVRRQSRWVVLGVLAAAVAAIVAVLALFVWLIRLLLGAL
jgi:hypothetical protein